MLDRLVSYLSDVPRQDLPDDVIERAKLHVLDTISATISGRALPAGQAGCRYLAIAAPASGSATVLGTTMTTSPSYAALANAMAAHADETDDSHERSRTHPGSSVVSCALAAAEAVNSSGQQFLRAVVAGYDVCCRMTCALWPDAAELNAQSHSTHAIGGLFGSAAAVAAITGRSHKQWRHIFSYCAQLCAGLETWVRDSDHVEKAFAFAGMAAFNGFMATALVDAGWTGVDDAFSGDPNFFEAMANAPCPELAVDELGTRFEVLHTNIKKFSVGSSSQAPLEGLLSILTDGAVPSADVREVRARISPALARTVVGRNMPNINIDYLLSAALDDRELSFANSHDETRFEKWSASGGDRRIVVVPDESLKTGRGAYITVSTHDGRTLERSVPEAPGTSGNPMSQAEVEAKAIDLVTEQMGTDGASRLVDSLRELDKATDVAELIHRIR